MEVLESTMTENDKVRDLLTLADSLDRKARNTVPLDQRAVHELICCLWDLVEIVEDPALKELSRSAIDHITEFVFAGLHGSPVNRTVFRALSERFNRSDLFGYEGVSDA